MKKEMARTLRLTKKELLEHVDVISKKNEQLRMDIQAIEKMRKTEKEEHIKDSIEKVLNDQMVGNELRAILKIMQILDKLRDPNKSKRVVGFILSKVFHGNKPNPNTWGQPDYMKDWQTVGVDKSKDVHDSISLSIQGLNL